MCVRNVRDVRNFILVRPGKPCDKCQMFKHEGEDDGANNAHTTHQDKFLQAGHFLEQSASIMDVIHTLASNNVRNIHMRVKNQYMMLADCSRKCPA